MSLKKKMARLEPLASPVSGLIASVGRGVAEAQRALDEAALETVDQIYQGNEKTAVALREIGYRPTWYRIPEVSAELKVAMRVEGTEQRGRAGGSGAGATQPPGPLDPRLRVNAHATPVDANYSNRFDYEVEASSTITFKVVPVPAPTGAEGRTQTSEE